MFWTLTSLYLVLNSSSQEWIQRITAILLAQSILRWAWSFIILFLYLKLKLQIGIYSYYSIYWTILDNFQKILNFIFSDEPFLTFVQPYCTPVMWTFIRDYFIDQAYNYKVFLQIFFKFDLDTVMLKSANQLKLCPIIFQQIFCWLFMFSI